MHVIQCSCLKDNNNAAIHNSTKYNICSSETNFVSCDGCAFFYTFKSCIIKCFIKQETSIGQGH